MALIKKHNPCSRGRHVEPGRPGELLSLDTFFVGFFKGVGKFSMSSIVDTFSSHAIDFLHISKQPEARVAVMRHDVLTFYKRHKRSVGAILPSMAGSSAAPRIPLRAVSGAERRRASLLQGQTLANQRLRRAFPCTAQDEFYRFVQREKVYPTGEALKDDFDKWLPDIRKRPHWGYRNNRRAPHETVHLFVSPTVKKAA